MVKDVPKERGVLIIPVYRHDVDSVFMKLPENSGNLEHWAMEALKRFNLAYTEPINGRRYLFTVCMEEREIEGDTYYAIDVDALLDDLKIFFEKCEDDALCINYDVLSDMDEYDEAVLYDECAKFKGLVNFHYPPIEIEEFNVD